MEKEPQEALRRADENAAHYKKLYEDLGPKIEEAISTVVGHRLTNHQLMEVTYAYCNYKRMANAKYIELHSIIN